MSVWKHLCLLHPSTVHFVKGNSSVVVHLSVSIKPIYKDTWRHKHLLNSIFGTKTFKCSLCDKKFELFHPGSMSKKLPPEKARYHLEDPRKQPIKNY